jgi:hypothetical protein
MNMEEKDKKRDTLEKAKTIMGKIDPALLSAALSEMMVEADEAEEADVAKVKKAIKGIYDSIPEGKDKTSIVSKAIMELDSEIIKKEVKVIKENLASIDKETIMEAAKDYVDVQEISNKTIFCSCALKFGISVQCACALKFGIGPFCRRCVKFFIIPDCACGIRYNVGPAREWGEWEIYPQSKEQLTEEIIQEVLQSPELSRAMKNMLKKIQDEK